MPETEQPEHVADDSPIVNKQNMKRRGVKEKEVPPNSTKCLETSIVRSTNTLGRKDSGNLLTNGQFEGEEMVLKKSEIQSKGYYSHKKLKRCWSAMTPLLVWISLFGIFSTFLLRAAIPIHLNVADEKFLEIRKCPACFGVTLCPAFLTGDIILESWSRFTITQLLNARNVFFARYKDKRVVLKKLGHDSKLAQLDHHILRITRNLPSSFPDNSAAVSAAVRPYTRQYLMEEYQHDIQGNSTFLVQHLNIFDPESRHGTSHLKSSLGANHLRGSDALVCPSKRKLEFIENQFVKQNFGLYRLTCLYNLMTILLHNSEPIVFQAFPSRDGWPFPEYLGACGRVIVEEYVGLNLAEWLPRATWQEKLKVASAMLKIAEKFTEGVNGFRLYATDVSLYNLAVSRDGVVKMVDGENIVIVDLQEIEKEKPLNYKDPYASDNAGCENYSDDPLCVSYDEQEMCNRLVNDHNYFAFCHELFSPSDNFGLLNELPAFVYEQFPLVRKYQNECFSSTSPGVRERAAKELISIYSQIIANS